MKKSNNTKGNPYHDEKGRFCSRNAFQPSRDTFDGEVETIEKAEELARSENAEFTVVDSEEEMYKLYETDNNYFDVEVTEMGNGTYHITGQYSTAPRGSWKEDPDYAESVDEYVFVSNVNEQVEEEIKKNKKDMMSSAEIDAEVSGESSYLDYGYSDSDAAVAEMKETASSYYDDYYDNAVDKLKKSSAEELQEYARDPVAFLESVGEETNKFSHDFPYYDESGEECYTDMSEELTEGAETGFIESESFVDGMYGRKVHEVSYQTELFKLALGEESIDESYISKYATRRIKSLGLVKEYKKYRKNIK